jgi:hypothetical protein
MKGIKTSTPLACARTPTIKGRTAAPPPPNAAQDPIALTWRCFGKSFVVTTTTAGNNGPKKNPCRDTAIAPAKKFGTKYRMRQNAISSEI